MNTGLNWKAAAPRAALAWLVAGAAGALVSCGGGDGGMAAPTLMLAVQPTSIVLGQSAELAWTSDAGNSCIASNGWSGNQAASGTSEVTPTAVGSVTYALSCSGAAYSGSATQSVTLAVSAPSPFTATALVGDRAGSGAPQTDTRLVNPWGIAFGPTSPVWVANAGTDTSTVYDGNGKAQPFAAPRIVAFAAGAAFAPTGIVFNGSTDFVVGAGSVSAPAAFIFSGEGGMIAGWAASVSPTQAVTMYTDSGGAVYKGLAIASNGSANHLYATDFRNAKIDVFDAQYRKQTPSATRFAFTDPNLPAGYAPFGIQAIASGPGGATRIAVAYARQSAADPGEEETGAGLGVVNLFDADGVFVARLVSPGGRLDAPWGMALAPASFGTLAGALLVGNFGDGRIHGYDVNTGRFIGTLADAANTPFAVPGLWGIAFGNGANNQPVGTLFYAAGTNDETAGVYGRIDLGSTPPVLNAPPVVAVSAPSGSLSGSVTLTANVTSALRIASVEFFVDDTTSIGIATTAPYTVTWDTTRVADGTATLSARATDVNTVTGTSPPVTVTVANGPTATTLAQLQASLFTPRCSGCHDGSAPAGGPLPGSMNLSNAAASYAALVGVASLEQPAVLRVSPGNPDASYLVRKVEGAASISGSRMPLGGPFLDTATIAQIRSWIGSGAPDN
jgi:uncharacterized protein (TIGR03118 family)